MDTNSDQILREILNEEREVAGQDMQDNGDEYEANPAQDNEELEAAAESEAPEDERFSEEQGAEPVEEEDQQTVQTIQAQNQLLPIYYNSCVDFSDFAILLRFKFQDEEDFERFCPAFKRSPNYPDDNSIASLTFSSSSSESDNNNDLAASSTASQVSTNLRRSVYVPLRDRTYSCFCLETIYEDVVLEVPPGSGMSHIFACHMNGPAGQFTGNSSRYDIDHTYEEFGDYEEDNKDNSDDDYEDVFLEPYDDGASTKSTTADPEVESMSSETARELKIDEIDNDTNSEGQDKPAESLTEDEGIDKCYEDIEQVD